MRSIRHRSYVFSLFLSGGTLLHANPTGGAVAAGSAAIAGQGTSAVTISQASRTAIINWQTFSIAGGQSTKFIQPSSTSATLNRVLGGETSLLDGSLTANGQIYLVNGNGIVIGPGGTIATGAFTASTRDISDSDFLAGNLHFTGGNDAGVQNLGSITALGGNVVLIGKTVDNKGKIQAPNGTAGLVAGDDVLLAQQNADGSTIRVNPAAAPGSANTRVGVHNSGTIRAASAELKAANGNIYALAIQNEGTIRATTLKHQGGHIYLTSDSGAVINSGLLDASATAAGGKGGTVALKSTTGTVSHTGKIMAQGGAGGRGGNAEISGATVQFTGLVDLTASGGRTGNLLIDPATLNVVAGGNGAVVTGQNDSTSTSIDPSTVEAALGTANLTLNANTNITVTNGIVWSSANTLTLSTNNSGSTINLNALISGVNGGLTIDTAGSADHITTGVNGTVQVGAFILENGSWIQNSATLPAFSATSNFELENGSNFLRVAGGNGSSGSPYQITDVYGLQGIGSPSHSLLGDSFVQDNSIAANGTATWNAGAGFSPIGSSTRSFTGNYNGAGYTIFGLTIDRPSQTYAGLFADLASGSIENVGLTGESITGNSITGGLLGYTYQGTVENCYATGAVSGTSFTGGLVGEIYEGTVNTCYTTVTVYGSTSIGGLVGSDSSGSTVEDSYATGAVSAYASYNGGLVGGNFGTVVNCYASGAVSGVSASGGLVGQNNGTVETSFATGATVVGYANGGLVGVNNGGTVETSYATGAVGGSNQDGGLVGVNDGLVETCYSTGAVGNGYASVGGLVGNNNFPGTPGTVIASYYAITDASGNSINGYGGAGTPETLAALKQQATFMPAGAGVPNWDFTNTWTTHGDTTPPLLQALSVTLSGTTPGGTDSVDLINGGAALYTTASVGSAYSFFVPDNVLSSGALLTDVTGNHAANTFYQLGLLPTGGSTIGGVNLSSNTLTVKGTGQAGNAQLGVASGSLNAATYGLTYTVDGSQDLTTNSGVGINLETGYLLNGNLTAGNATLTTSAELTSVAADAILTANSISLGGPFISARTVTFNATGAITDTGAVQVGGFILENGSWSQNSATLPAFSTTSNFELENSSNFLRVAGGVGSSGSPYQITDVYGLQGIGSPSNSLLDDSFVQNNNIDAGGTVTWNPSGMPVTYAGFTPIGNYNNAFSGNYNGAGYTISGLTIDQPSQDEVGLFGQNTSGSILENIGLSGGSLSGASYVGGLVGDNEGIVKMSYATSAVTAGSDSNYVGGLVGTNDGVVETSYATGAVTVGDGSSYVGGLVGVNDGTVETSYATGAVTAGDTASSVGGLVGLNFLTVESCYETGAVTVGSNANDIGGLVGFNLGTVETSYETGAVTAGSDSFYVGGLAGDNVDAEASYYATTDASGNPINPYANGFGTPETFANLKLQSTFQPAGTGAGEWDFTLGTGVWGINGYASTGLINNGLPYFQWQYPTQARVTPTSQVLAYSGTAGVLSQSAYTVTFAPTYSNLSSLLASGPTLTAAGSNVNVVNAGAANTVAVTLVPNAGDVVEVSTVPATVTYSAVPLTITATNQTKVYGAALPTLTASYTGFVDGQTSASLATGPTLTTPATAASNVSGSPYSITASGAVDSNYSISYVGGSLTVTPAPLTITANNQSKVYGAALPTLTASYTGFVEGQTSASLTTQPTLATTATAASGVAGSPYSITASGAADNNYAISYVTGNLTVTAAPLTITANNQTKVYGAALPTLTASYTGFVEGQTSASLTTQPTLATTATAASGVAGSPYSITASGAADSNYAISYVAGNLTVTPAPLTITANNQTKVYGAAVPTLTASYTGFVNGNNSSSLGDQPTLTTTATAASSVAASPYSITASGAVDTNYTISYVSGSLSVTAAPLTITADSQTKVYGAAVPTLTASYTGFVNGDTAVSLSTEPTLSTPATAASGVAGSPYSITASGAADSNYSISYVAGNLTVTAAPLTITADDKTKVYGAGVPTLTASFTGFVNGDTTASLSTQPTLSTPATAASGVAGSPYIITASGAADSNYSISYVAGNLTVTAAPLTITADDKTKVYGAAVPALTASITGFVNGDNFASFTTDPTLSTTATAASSVAGSPYDITASGAVDSNYSISYVAGTLTVTQAPLTVTADNQTKVYGAAVPTLTASFTGFVNGDTSASLDDEPTLTTTATAASSVAGNPYDITVSGAVDSNYSISYVAGTLTVTQAPLTITADNQTKVYGTAVPTLTASFTGFVNGDTSASLGNQPVLTTTATAGSNVAGGPYSITASGAADSDYSISYVAGALTVTPATLTYVANPGTRQAGQPNAIYTGTVLGFVNGDNRASATTGTLVFTTNATSTSLAGSYAIVGSGLSADNGNYLFVQAPGNATALTIESAPSGGAPAGGVPAGLLADLDNFDAANDASNYSGTATNRLGSSSSNQHYMGREKRPKGIIAFGSSYQYLGHRNTTP